MAPVCVNPAFAPPLPTTALYLPEPLCLSDHQAVNFTGIGEKLHCRPPYFNAMARDLYPLLASCLRISCMAAALP